MGIFKEAFVYSFHKQPLIYLRYIDNVLMLWHHDKTSLRGFFNHASLSHKSINFTFHYSEETVNFLDVNIELNRGLLPPNSSGNQQINANSCTT